MASVVERGSGRDAVRTYGVVSGALIAWADRYRWWLWAFVAVVYMVGFTGIYRPEPDSAL